MSSVGGGLYAIFASHHGPSRRRGGHGAPDHREPPTTGLTGLWRTVGERQRSPGVVCQTSVGPDDADWGKKTYRGVDAQGKAWEKVVAWFGYQIHFLVDATDELPIAWMVTKASIADITEASILLAQCHDNHPLALKACRVLTADRRYDATALVQSLWDDDGIKPVIDIWNLCKDGEAIQLLPGHDTVTYHDRGEVFCHHPDTGQAHPMATAGLRPTEAR